MNLANTLERLHPTKLMIVKFEMLVTQPKLVIKSLLEFLNLPWHPAMDKFMAEHMVEDPKHRLEGDLHTQSVNSSAKAHQWKTKLSLKQLNEVERVCEELIEKHEKLSMRGI